MKINPSLATIRSPLCHAICKPPSPGVEQWTPVMSQWRGIGVQQAKIGEPILGVIVAAQYTMTYTDTVTSPPIGIDLFQTHVTSKALISPPFTPIVGSLWEGWWRAGIVGVKTLATLMSSYNVRRWIELKTPPLFGVCLWQLISRWLIVSYVRHEKRPSGCHILFLLFPFNISRKKFHLCLDNLKPINLGTINIHIIYPALVLM